MSEKIRVAVTGALGRMGVVTVSWVCADPDLELVAAVDVAAAGGARSQLASGTGIPVLGGLELVDPEEIDVIIDFTRASSAVLNVTWALENGVHAVVGTTGIEEKELHDLERRSEESGANVILAANFAIGAVLMMRFAEIAARSFDQCEIVELHHRGKQDAPSGTALATAARVAKAMRPEGVPEPRRNEIEGSRGGAFGPVAIHSVRLDGLVAHQEVLFGSEGQTLSIRHDTTDRSCFMPGVMLAVKAVGSLPGLTIGLDSILGI